ncbi:MAG TPA: ABC transporter substrate-binding protein [Micropepsaceae bacterium]|nr:ABC transporter substrate-binding protein [Micropepsaceae bacterium]
MTKSSAVFASGFVALCMFAGSSAQANPATEAFIQENFNKGYTILNNMALSDSERRAQFRTLLVSLAASRRIALFTLGTYATGAAPATLDGFVDAFTKYSFATYERGLNRYDGQTLKVTGSTDRAADDSIVQADILSANPADGRSIKVGFRVRKSEAGAPVITDVLIEGISLASAERDEFTAYLKQHDGSIPALSKRLDAMAEKGEPVN